MKHLLRLQKKTPHLRWLQFGYYLFIAIGTFFSIFNFTLIIPLLDLLFNTTSSTPPPPVSFSVEHIKGFLTYQFHNFVVEHGRLETLKLTCLVVIISIFCSNLFKYLAAYIMNIYRTESMRVIRQELFEKVLQLDTSYWIDEKKGNLMTLFSNDMKELEDAFTHLVSLFSREPVALIIIYTTLFTLSTELTLFTFVLFPVAGAGMAFINKKLRKDAFNVQSILSNLLSLIDESILGHKIIKIFNAEHYVNAHFKTINTTYTHLLRTIHNRKELASPFSEFIGVVVVAAILYYGGSLILDQNSNLSASSFLAFIALYSQILVPIKNISTASGCITRGEASAQRVTHFLDTAVQVDANHHIASEETSVSFDTALEFRNLSFYYDAKTPILKNVSFTLPKGKTVALVGASGSGKSTLADLAVRFYDVVDGGIFLDGVNIKTLNLNAYRSLFAMVTQESILFNDTLASNIYFGSSIHDAERFNLALETSYLKEVVEGLEGKELFNVGERGNKLSGGQKQRLSIARAIYKNAPILILDEATSALDNVSEARIQEELEQVVGHQTCLMIAHRLSTVQKADHIIVLEKGEIIEQGTHQDLIQLNGTYKKMFELQSLNAS